MGRFLWGLGLLGGLSLVLALAWLAGQSSSPTISGVLPPATLSPTAVRSVPSPAPTPAPAQAPERQWRLSEEEINARLRAAVATTPLPAGLAVREIRVTLLPGQITAKATVQVSGFDLPVEAGLQPFLDGETVALRLESLSLSGTALPAPLRDQIARLITEQVAALRFPLPPDLDPATARLAVEAGRLVISGRPRAGI